MLRTFIWIRGVITFNKYIIFWHLNFGSSHYLLSQILIILKIVDWFHLFFGYFGKCKLFSISFVQVCNAKCKIICLVAICQCAILAHLYTIISFLTLNIWAFICIWQIKRDLPNIYQVKDTHLLLPFLGLAILKAHRVEWPVTKH